MDHGHSLSLLTLHVLPYLHTHSAVHNLKENTLLAIHPPQSSLAVKKTAILPTRTDVTRGARSGTAVAVWQQG